MKFISNYENLLQMQILSFWCHFSLHWSHFYVCKWIFKV